MQVIDLDISSYQTPQVIYAKQGDVGRKFAVHLTDGGQAYTPPQGAWFSLWYSGTSGCGNYTAIEERSAFSVEDNSVTVELIGQMLVNKGGGTLCLVLHQEDGSQIGWWNIPYHCEEVPGSGSGAATAHYTALTEYARAAAESARQAAETCGTVDQLRDEMQQRDAQRLPVGVYTGEAIVVNADTPTDQFWKQAKAALQALEPGSVRFLMAQVQVPFGSNFEPEVGSYHMVLSKDQDGNGIIRAEGTPQDPWGAPMEYIVIYNNGTWSIPSTPRKQIHESCCGQELWQAEALTDSFPAQTITLDSRADDCNALVIDFVISSSIPYYQSVLLRRGWPNGILGCANFPIGSIGSTSITKTLSRYCQWDGRRVLFYDAYKGSTRDNTGVIPYRIHGTSI